MIETLPLDGGDLVALRAHGMLTHQDYRDRIVPRLEQAILEHGTARLLCVLDEDFKGITAAAAWDDLRFDAAHRKDFTRIALVTDSGLVRAATRVFLPFFGGESRLFSLAERAEAERWIQGDPAG
jgi:hypothetical protein